jgi:hypothetical protein
MTPSTRAKRFIPVYMWLVGFMISMVTLLKGLKHLGLEHRFRPRARGFANALPLAALVGLLVAIGGPPAAGIRYVPNEDDRFASVERVFAVLMIFTACSMAFAHGSNDVANAVGPLAAVASIVQSGGRSAATAAMPGWILLTGALGIVVGLATYGWKVIATVGRKITELTPSRGFAAELAAASTVVIASATGLPISTTHTLVGAVLGVGLARGIAAIDLRVIGSIFVSWIITLPAGARAGDYLLLHAARHLRLTPERATTPSPIGWFRDTAPYIKAAPRRDLRADLYARRECLGGRLAPRPWLHDIALLPASACAWCWCTAAARRSRRASPPPVWTVASMAAYAHHRRRCHATCCRPCRRAARRAGGAAVHGPAELPDAGRQLRVGAATSSPQAPSASSTASTTSSRGGCGASTAGDRGPARRRQRRAPLGARLFAHRRGLQPEPRGRGHQRRARLGADKLILFGRDRRGDREGRLLRQCVAGRGSRPGGRRASAERPAARDRLPRLPQRRAALPHRQLCGPRRAARRSCSPPTAAAPWSSRRPYEQSRWARSTMSGASSN